MCIRDRLNVEAAPFGRRAVRDVRAGDAPYFHANEYQAPSLVGGADAIAQTLSNSSTHRRERAAQLPPPRGARDALGVLGDQDDVDGSGRWPIFHDALSHARGELSDWTLATVLFDLERATATLYHGNPRRGDVLLELPIAELGS